MSFTFAVQHLNPFAKHYCHYSSISCETGALAKGKSVLGKQSENPFRRHFHPFPPLISLISTDESRPTWEGKTRVSRIRLMFCWTGREMEMRGRIEDEARATRLGPTWVVCLWIVNAPCHGSLSVLIARVSFAEKQRNWFPRRKYYWHIIKL